MQVEHRVVDPALPEHEHRADRAADDDAGQTGRREP